MKIENINKLDLIESRRKAPTGYMINKDKVYIANL